MASSGNGFMTSSWSLASMVVAPWARYQELDAVVEHGVLDQPSEVLAASATTALVPYTSMSTPVNGAAAESRGTTTAWLCGATVSAPVIAGASPGKYVIVPVIGVSVGLSTVTLPSPVDLSAAAGTPGHNHAVVRAAPAPQRAIGMGGVSLEQCVAATRAGRSRENTTPATTKAATAITTRRRRKKVLMVRSRPFWCAICVA